MIINVPDIVILSICIILTLSIFGKDVVILFLALYNVVILFIHLIYEVRYTF
jgi:hypothetical protein